MRSLWKNYTGDSSYAVALVPVWTGQDVKNVLYTADKENGPTWSLWAESTWGDSRSGMQTQDLRPTTLQSKKRYWEHMKGFKLLRLWLTLNQSFSWHPGAGLDVHQEDPLCTSCSWCYVEYVGHPDHPMGSLCCGLTVRQISTTQSLAHSTQWDGGENQEKK